MLLTPTLTLEVWSTIAKLKISLYNNLVKRAPRCESLTTSQERVDRKPWFDVQPTDISWPCSRSHTASIRCPLPAQPNYKLRSNAAFADHGSTLASPASLMTPPEARKFGDGDMYQIRTSSAPGHTSESKHFGSPADPRQDLLPFYCQSVYISTFRQCR